MLQEILSPTSGNKGLYYYDRWRKFLDILRTYDSIWKIATGQEDDYTTVVCWIISISKITIQQ